MIEGDRGANMDKEIQRLMASDLVGRLDRLEEDFWRREQVQRQAAVASRQLLSWQGLVLALAVLCSASVGAAVAHARRSPEASWFNDGPHFVPTTLLFGANP
jgi:hypothetical protein